jgi:hypothetical protein
MSTFPVKEHEGEYYLRGIPETASGFKLNHDKSFEFFFIYGALDRHGSGKWKAENDQLIFQSRPWPGKDFALLKSKTVSGDQVTIRIIDKNENVLRYVSASLRNGEKDSWQAADPTGVIRLPKQAVTTISLAFEFCSERFSDIPVENELHNYFEFRIEPWLVEYFFNDFRLTITREGLKGKHPMLNGDDFTYEKRTHKL